jgi:hypothetical protein
MYVYCGTDGEKKCRSGGKGGQIIFALAGSEEDGKYWFDFVCHLMVTMVWSTDEDVFEMRL